jgi:chromosome segregation ATPase
VSFENIKTNDLLSILLALFAIGLSAAFFIKANQVSNMFYDNMYKFTKDNSELLGRMESGFSEQLRHLDQGYSGLRDKFDRLPLDLNKTKEKVEDEKAEVKKLDKERRALLDELAARANLQAEEKTELFDKLRNSESQLNRAEKELQRLQRKIRNAADSEATVHGVLVRAVKHTQRKVIDQLDIDIHVASDDEIISAWNRIKDKFSRVYFKDLKRGDVLDDDDQLTEKGIWFIKEVANGNV